MRNKYVKAGSRDPFNNTPYRSTLLKVASRYYYLRIYIIGVALFWKCAHILSSALLYTKSTFKYNTAIANEGGAVMRLA